MKRKEFLRLCTLLGMSLPMQSFLLSCKKEDVKFSGKVLIIGAGVAGLCAAYLLKQKNIAFQIIEASSSHGGRLKVNKGFADFPIPLGAEWLHVEKTIFSDIVNDSSVQITTPTINYKESDTYAKYENGNLTLDELGDYEDQKFFNGSWLDFFETYIVPKVKDEIYYDSVVSQVNYSGKELLLTTSKGTFKGDKLLITVPLRMLQKKQINFVPSLPISKISAINSAQTWGGLKVFIEFSKKFYPTITDVSTSDSEDGEVLIYDAAYGQNTTKSILGFFAVGSTSLKYTSLSDNEIIDLLLLELDKIFSNQATPNYLKSIVQNWSSEKYIESAYLSDSENWKTVTALFQPIDEKVFFAGEAYTRGEDWGGVHNAAQAARDAVELMIQEN